jgi:hypothetical protein
MEAGSNANSINVNTEHYYAVIKSNHQCKELEHGETHVGNKS